MIVSSASRPIFTYGTIAATVAFMLIGWRDVSSARSSDSENNGHIVEVRSSGEAVKTDDFVATLLPIDKKAVDSPSTESDVDSRKVRPGDIVAIWIGNGLPGSQDRGRYRVESTGKIALGPDYGRVKVAGLTIEGVEKSVESHLTKILQHPRVTATFDHLPGEAQVTTRYIASANDPLIAGEVLRIRIGSSYSQPIYDEIVEIESDARLPIGFLFTRLNTKSKSLSELENEIRALLEQENVVSRARVLITRVKEKAPIESNEFSRDIDQIRQSLEDLRRRQ